MLCRLADRLPAISRVEELTDARRCERRRVSAQCWPSHRKEEKLLQQMRIKTFLGSSWSREIGCSRAGVSFRMLPPSKQQQSPSCTGKLASTNCLCGCQCLGPWKT